jgi:hypothetical protein
VVAHQRLVDGADLLDVEGAIAEPLALEDDEALEHGMHDAVVDLGRAQLGAGLGVHDRGGAAGQATFEEGVAAGVEEATAAGRQHEVAVAHADEHAAKEREEAAVGTEAVVHRLGVHAGVVDELRVEALHGHVLGVGRVGDRQQALVLGVEQEHEAQHDAEHALIEVVVRGIEGGVEPGDVLALAGGGGFEALEQDLDGLEHLRGEVFGDVGLAASTLAQQTLERVLGRGLVGAAGVEDELEGGEQRATGWLREVGEAEGQVRGRLARGRVHEAKRATVAEQADRDAGRSQESLELGGRRVAPRAGLGLGLVEVEAERAGVVAQVPHEREVGAGVARARGRRRMRARGCGREGGEGIVGVGLEGAAGDRKAGPDVLAAFFGVEGQLGGQGVALDEHAGARVAEELGEEAAQVGQRGRSVVIDEPRTKAGAELGPDERGDLGVGEHGDREHEALDRLGEAEPLVVKAGLCVVAHVIASGHATTSPTGTRRVMWTS